MATSLYDIDFVAWTRQQATELRRLNDSRLNVPLDFALLADEVEDLGSERKLAFESFLEVIIEHLLKLSHSPAVAPRKKWMISIHAARRSALRRMTGSLRREAAEDLDKLFEGARSAVVFSMRLYGEIEAIDTLPTSNPYTLDQLLDTDWWPDNTMDVDRQ